mgnify:CR=1 FL=1
MKNYEKSYEIYVDINNLSQQGILMGELYRVCARLGNQNSTQKWREGIELLYENLPSETRIYIDDCLKA